MSVCVCVEDRGAVGHIGSVDRFQLSIPIIHWGCDLPVNGLTAWRRSVGVRASVQ